MDKRITILYEDNHLLVVEKPSNIPVMEDDSKDEDLLSILKKDLKVRYNKPGDVYLGLVHRLDRPVGGVMVFAKTSKAASRLRAQVSSHQLFQKEYHAVVTGHPQATG
ncbi:MAG: RNA pseudouridine synthase, partial [Lachnospiraceae bacterium]|nr:RNA pseudouridine synthase [Lachnospiraceae bacterium]